MLDNRYVSGRLLLCMKGKNKRLYKFFIEIFEFADEQLAAIDYQIPITQEIYDSVCPFMPKR